jgi:hypothetical protein
MCTEKVTRQSQRDWVGTEEKYEYEAFVTDPSTCGRGGTEITSDVEKRKTCRAGLLLLPQPTVRRVLLNRDYRRMQLGKKKKTSTRLLLQLLAGNQSP